MIKIILCSILIIVPRLILAQNTIAIINGYIDSTGGYENWQKIKSMYQESQSFYQDSYDESATLTTVNKFNYLNRIFRKWDPDKQKTETYKSGVLKLERYCYQQASYLVLPNKEPVPSLFTHYYQLLPKKFQELIDREETASFKYIGEKKIGSSSYHVVQIPFNNFVMDYYFDKQTTLLEYAYFLNEKNRFIKYEDYREVNGIKLPFKTTIINKGTAYYEGQITKVEFNTKIDDSIFEF